MAELGIYQRPFWWSNTIDGVLLEHYQEKNPSFPFDIDKFKTEITIYAWAYKQKYGTPWRSNVFDIDILISMLAKFTGDIPKARAFVLNSQWSDTEPKRYRDLGMVCPCGREEHGKIYMRKRHSDPREKSGIGFPRAGCCGSEVVLVLNPMPKTYAAVTLDKRAERSYHESFDELNSNEKGKILADVRQYRKALVMHWLSCQGKVEKAEAGFGEKDGPKRLQKCRRALEIAKGDLDVAGGFFPWNKAYDKMPRVKDDDFS